VTSGREPIREAGLYKRQILETIEVRGSGEVCGTVVEHEGEMTNPQTQSPQPSPQSSDVDLEWLAGQLADEAEYWRARAETVTRALDDLIAQVELAGRTEQSSIRQSRPSAAPFDDGIAVEPTIFRNGALILFVSLILWACVAVFALAVFRYFVD
jgi:hypothetical protein